MSKDMLGEVVRKLVQLPEEMLGAQYDLLEKLTGERGKLWACALKRMLRGEQSFSIPPTFDVTTNGRNGEEWIMHLEQRHYCVGAYAKQLLRNKKFAPTNGVTYKLAVIMGDELDDSERTNQNIREIAHSRGFHDPSLEVAPYLREMFSDDDLKKMGLEVLIIMHEPLTDSDGDLALLSLSRRVDGHWLINTLGIPGFKRNREEGFVFLVPTSG